MSKIEVEILDKHKNYLQYYKPNDLYWGIGIENEMYLEMSIPLKVDKRFFFTKNAKRERYSLNYFESYKPHTYDIYVNKLNLKDSIPLLVNAHSFLKTDINNEHSTTYDTNPEPNPKYSGKTLYDFIIEKDPYFKDEYMKSFIFDGDTIEFVSQNFYKSTIDFAIAELDQNKKIFINKLKKIFKDNKIFQEYGEIDFCKINHPFVSFMTNLNNCSIFNNMTYHFNFTLPTKLNDKGLIEDYELFIKKHKNAIHLIQWVEPLLLAIFGSGDILSSVNNKLSNTSQRCAKSRYISIGTYDTDKMTPGKILQIESDNNHLSNIKYWWFNKYYENSDYTKEKKIGVDINFHKHKNHGIEVRIFDYFDPSKLYDVLKFFVLLLDFSLDNNIESPVKDIDWNNFVCDVLKNRNTVFNEQIKQKYENLFKLKTRHNTINKIYEKIYKKLLRRYENNGICYNKMIDKSHECQCKIC
jgi:hypothetical protein